jgi:hypothetical protein
MIVLDEHLQGLGVEEGISRWYRGSVCLVTDLRPDAVVKDEMIPALLRACRKPTFVTLNWKHFWRRSLPHVAYCMVSFTLATSRAPDVAPLLRRVFGLPAFATRAARTGTVARVSEAHVAVYRVGEPIARVLSVP